MLIKKLIFDNQISLSIIDGRDIVSKAVKIHKLGDAPAETLGGMLIAAAYMSGCLKSPKGAVSLTVKSGDGSATVSVSGDVNGNIRGYIDGQSLKGGVMTVIKDDGFYRPFVGASELLSEDISENLEQYFRASEQIPTHVSIGARVRGGKCISAGGVVLQQLPGASPENAERAARTAEELKDVCTLLEELGADGILSKYFPEEPAEGTYKLFPQYRCTCSRAKIARVIAPLGREELESIIKEQGKISVHCHYCNKDYIFTQADVEKLVK